MQLRDETSNIYIYLYVVLSSGGKRKMCWKSVLKTMEKGEREVNGYGRYQGCVV